MIARSVSFVATERTVIEYITLDDAPFFVSLLNSPDWLRYIGDRQINTVEDASRYLQGGFVRSYADYGYGYYLIKALPDRVPVGICGFLNKPELDNPDFGFALVAEYYGQGYALESCRAVLDRGIQAFDFAVLDAVTKVANLRSIRLLEKLGFERLGVAAANVTGDDLLLYRWHRAAGREGAEKTVIHPD